jgi:outer membrane protein insertion porin family
MTQLSASLGWSLDTRDNLMMPKEGRLTRLNGELSVPGFDIQTYKVFLQNSEYTKINNSITFGLNGQFAYTDSYGDKPFPFFKNLFVGGVNSVRGYRQSAIGPYQMNTANGQNLFLGGNKQLVVNAELFMPMPFIKNNDQFRLSTFIDAGNVYTENEGVDLASLRYSAGVGVMWVSPFGPLKLVYAKPFNNQVTDVTENIQFQMGQQF